MNEWEEYSSYLVEDVCISRNWATTHFLTFLVGFGTVMVPVGVSFRSFSLLVCYNLYVLRLKIQQKLTSLPLWTHLVLISLCHCPQAMSSGSSPSLQFNYLQALFSGKLRVRHHICASDIQIFIYVYLKATPLSKTPDLYNYLPDNITIWISNRHFKIPDLFPSQSSISQCKAPLYLKVSEVRVIFNSPLPLIYYIRSITKSCWVYLKIYPNSNNFPLLWTWFEPPSSIAWIITIVS